MKTGKKILMFLAAAAAMVTLTACGSSKPANIDVNAVADELNSNVSTTDQLNKTKNEMLSSIYFFEDGQVTGGTVYMSGNATANEIAALECKDEAAAKDAAELLKNRVKAQAELFQSYNADEAAKLDKAIVKTSGKYVVMVVCDDYAKAEEILKKAGF